MPRSRRVNLILFVAGALFLLLAAGVGFLAWKARGAEEKTRQWIEQALSERFHSDVELQTLHVQIFPRMGVEGEGLALRYHGRRDVPPLIQIKKFSFHLGPLGILEVPHRIQNVNVQNMVITIPPRRKDAKDETDQPLESQRQAEGDASTKSIPSITVGEIVCDNTQLILLPKQPGKQPLDWEIHNLVLQSVGADKPFSFTGTLTNAKPKGEIATKGKFGPWNSDDPGSTPVLGAYAFTDADLGPFPGIAGILSSTGKYKGPLDELEVEGETDTPNFSLDRVGKPVPLHTEYSATVDGTNGDTFLHPVRATLGHSLIVAQGSVVKVPDKGHSISLDVATPNARIEDMLALAVDSDKPFMTGPVKVNAKLLIPPGKIKVIDKMILDGTFGIDRAHWTSAAVRDKLEALSRHGEGKPADEDAGSSVSDLQGSFRLENGTITFRRLSFSVPGAAVRLTGTYKIRSGDLDFQGQLRLQAKLSQTVTGKKSFFLKAIDPLFSKDSAGTELPITVTGTRENPVLGVSVFHKKFEKQMGNGQNNEKQNQKK